MTHAPTGIRVVHDNEPQNPTTTTKPWIRYAFRPGASKPVSTGFRPIQEMVGRLEMSVFVPTGKGNALSDDLADQCESIFRNYTWQMDGNRLDFEGFERTTLPEPQWYSVKVSGLWRATIRP